ncbi:MAG: 4Fe-4S binding protein [Thermogutta sp.]
MGRIVLAAVAVMLWQAGVGFGEERFPPPDFTYHKMPETPVPSPDSPLWELVDMAALLVALIVTAYLALGRRSRNGLLILAAVSLLWFGFRRQGCVCSIGAIQDVAEAAFNVHRSVPFTVIVFFTLPIVFALFFGRAFCAAVCPLGAIQELAAIRPQHLPLWLEHTLGIVPWVYLGLAVLYAATGTAYVICEYDPFVAFFRRSGAASMLTFGACLLVIGMFIGRPYCRFLCPYGVILGLASKLARWHVRIPPTACIRCRLCEDACPYGAIVSPPSPLSPGERRKARRRLLLFLAAIPLWMALGAAIGRMSHAALARMDYQVRLAGWLAAENQIDPNNKFALDAVRAFQNTGRSPSEVFATAAARLDLFRTGGTLLGAWIGLVIGLKLAQLCTRTHRDDYHPDPRRCVACGRCFWYCPEEQVRRGWIQSVEAVLPQGTAVPLTAIAPGQPRGTEPRREGE